MDHQQMLETEDVSLKFLENRTLIKILAIEDMIKDLKSEILQQVAPCPATPKPETRKDSGPVFDNAMYDQVKPHLILMWKEAKATTADMMAALRDFLHRVLADLGDNAQALRPYIKQFGHDVINGVIADEETPPSTITQPDGEAEPDDDFTTLGRLFFRCYFPGQSDVSISALAQVLGVRGAGKWAKKFLMYADADLVPTIEKRGRKRITPETLAMWFSLEHDRRLPPST